MSGIILESGHTIYARVGAIPSQNPQQMEENCVQASDSTASLSVDSAFISESRATIQRSKDEIGLALGDIEKMAIPQLEPGDLRINMIEQAVTLATESSDKGRDLLRRILLLNADVIYKPGDALSTTDIAKHSIQLHDERKAVFVKDIAMIRGELEIAVKLIGALVEKEILRKSVHGSAFNRPPKIVAK